MALSNTGKSLMKILKEIDNNYDFVCGVMTNLKSEKAWDISKMQ